MLFIFVSIAVPILVYLLLPRVLSVISGKTHQPTKLLLVAGLVYFISWYLPSPLIDGKDTSFTTHVVGGGIFTGFVWAYLVQQLGWKRDVLQDALGLFALTSALGAANELFELLIVRLGLVRLTLTDTSWDILANTLGALVFFGVYSVIRRRSGK